jgi:hypothetical protein
MWRHALPDTGEELMHHENSGIKFRQQGSG